MDADPAGVGSALQEKRRITTTDEARTRAGMRTVPQAREARRSCSMRTDDLLTTFLFTNIPAIMRQVICFQ
jgi:hypothetical protein